MQQSLLERELPLFLGMKFNLFAGAVRPQLENSSPAFVVHMYLASLVLEDRRLEIEDYANRYIALWGNDDREEAWDCLIVRLLAYDMSSEAIELRIECPTQRSQWCFYSGMLRFAEGARVEARELLQQGEDCETSCPERSLCAHFNVVLSRYEPRPKHVRFETARLFRACIRYFMLGMYKKSAQEALALIQRGSRHDLMQIILLSLQRDGREDLAGQLGLKFSQSNFGQQWTPLLLLHTVGAIDAASLLSCADNSLMCSEAHYYIGERLLSLGQDDEAKANFGAAVELNLSEYGVEANLAGARLAMMSSKGLNEAILEPWLDTVERLVASPHAISEYYNQQGRSARGYQAYDPNFPNEEARSLFDRCKEALLQLDYQGCVEAASACLKHCVHHETILMILHCMKEARLNENARELGLRAIDQFENVYHELARARLLRLAIDEVDSEEAIFLAKNDKEKCQAHYYSALNHLAANDCFQARVHLSHAAAANVECFEHEMACELLNRHMLSLSAAPENAILARVKQLMTLARDVRIFGKSNCKFVEYVDEARRLHAEHLGVDTEFYAVILGALAGVCQSTQDSVQYARHAVNILREIKGEASPDFVRFLGLLSSCLYRAGEYAEATMHVSRAIELERNSEESSGQLADLLECQGNLHATGGKLIDAIACGREAMSIFQSADRPNSEDISRCMTNLANYQEQGGDLRGAAGQYREALAIARRDLGNDHENCTRILNYLGRCCRLLGNHSEAARCYIESRENVLKNLGSNHPLYASVTNNLAKVYIESRDYQRAQELLEHSVRLSRQNNEDQNPKFAIILHNLAYVYQEMERFDDAIKLHTEGLYLRIRSFGETHRETALSMSYLASFTETVGLFDQAQDWYQRTLDCYNQIHDSMHPDIADLLINYANLELNLGATRHAAELLERSVAIMAVRYHSSHPHHVHSKSSLANARLLLGEKRAALELLEQVMDADDLLLASIFTITHEESRDKLYEAAFRRFCRFMHLALLEGTAQQKRRALDAVLRRKAVIAEFLYTRRDAVLSRQYVGLGSKLRRLRDVQQQISTFFLANVQHQQEDDFVAQYSTLLREKSELEIELQRSIPEFHLQQRIAKVDSQSVAASLPSGSALIEYALLDQDENNDSRYVAFLLRAESHDAMKVFDLGDASTIDRQVERFRHATLCNEKKEPTAAQLEAAVKLREMIFESLFTSLEGVKRLIISGDGSLNQVPLQVLLDHDGQMLLDKYEINYVFSGREVLVGDSIMPVSSCKAVVVCDPDYDYGAAGNEIVGSRPFQPLPGTRVEGEAVARLFGVEAWTSARALKGRLKRVSSPEVLHLATHGFFLPLLHGTPTESMGRLNRLRFERSSLFRSGLALAGINVWDKFGSPPQDAEDGVLTAVDVASLDLSGTRLVVLSACESGLGDEKSGHGTLGVRRSFMIAGAKAVLSTLWPIPDYETQLLMEAFYRNLLRGMPVGTALRDAQQELRNAYPNPYFWGGFICHGDSSAKLTASP